MDQAPEVWEMWCTHSLLCPLQSRFSEGQTRWCFMDMQEIKDLIDIFSKSNVDKLELEKDGFELKLAKTRPEGVPVPVEAVPQPVAAIAVPAAEPGAAASADESLLPVNSPIVGTFYRAPNPTSQPFVQVGDRVRVGQTMCIVEAMKLMNEIQAEQNGVVEKILVENGQAVEYNQPLFLLKPA